MTMNSFKGNSPQKQTLVGICLSMTSRLPCVFSCMWPNLQIAIKNKKRIIINRKPS